jgi:hypothetical protein
MAMCFSSWNEEGGICGVGDKHCAICGSGGGGCLATMSEDLFSLASERQLVERLNEGKYPNYKQLMIDTLKKIYNHEYTEIEELKPLPKQLNCCTPMRSMRDDKYLLTQEQVERIRQILEKGDRVELIPGKERIKIIREVRSEVK